MSPLLPARCTRCGHVWQPHRGGILIENAIDGTVTGSSTTCERCGGRAQFIEGTMNVIDGAIEMRSGPQWSWDVVESLRLTLRRVVDDAPDDPIGPIENVSPAIGSRLRSITTGWNKEAVIALLALIVYLLDWGGTQPKDIASWLSEIPEQVASLLDEAERNGPPTPPPSGTATPPTP